MNSSNTSLLYSANNIFNTCLQRTPNNEIYFSFSPRYVSQVSNPSIYNSSVLVDLINGNPDNPNPLRYAGSYMPQLIPKLNCALYEDLKGNNITNNYTYQVSNRITTSSDYTVNENQTINLFAKDYIEFKANTHLKSNSTVWAKIQACPGSSGRMADENAIKNDAVSQSTNDLIIAPNPVTDFVLIKTSQTGFNKVTISSLDGKVVKTETVENTMEYSLNASGIAKGIYLISVTSKEGSLLTQKLIKN